MYHRVVAIIVGSQTEQTLCLIIFEVAIVKFWKHLWTHYIQKKWHTARENAKDIVNIIKQNDSERLFVTFQLHWLLYFQQIVMPVVFVYKFNERYTDHGR